MSNYYPQGMQQQYPIQSNYYAQSPIVKAPSNPIGEEGIKALMASNNKLFFDVKQKDVWEMLCHHTHDGRFETYPINEQGTLHKCRVCGQIINIGADISEKDLQAAVALLMIAWQQAKVSNYGCVSADLMYDYAQSFAVMRKFPDLYNFVMANFRKNKTQSQQTQNGYANVGQQTFNAIHNTSGFGYNPVYNSGAPTMVQSQPINGNPFQPTIQQPVMYVPQQPQVMQPQQYVMPNQQYPQQQQIVTQQPIVVAQQYPQPQAAYSYEQQQPVMPVQQQPLNQPPMPQAPPAAAGTVVPENQPPVAYPPKPNDGQIPGKTDSVKRALGFNL